MKLPENGEMIFYGKTVLKVWGKLEMGNFLYWRCIFGLTVIGLFSVAGAAFAVGWVNPLAGAIIALGGLGKPAGYAIGWKVFKDGSGDGWKELNEATEIGEALTGLFAYLSLGIAVIILWGAA